MATTPPTPTWSYGKVVNLTDSGVTDDTERWSYGKVWSILDYAAASGTTVAPTTSAPTTTAPTTLAPTTLAPTTLAPTSLAPTTISPTTLAPTTLEPTTLAPTTLAPTTIAPTTTAPTTLAPTTLAPTSLAPTTLAPTTLAPTTLTPTTIAPTSLVPTTIAPTTLAPTTLAPTTTTPTTVVPTSLAPTSLAPTTLAPTTVLPTTLAPTTLEPTTLAPTTLAPTTLSPTTLAPTTLAPTTLAPTTLAPTTISPTTLEPTTLAPTTLAPTTMEPTTLAPTSLAPTTLAPTTMAPTTLAPTSLAPTTVAPTTCTPASYVTDFSEYTTDSTPGDWTLRWDNGDQWFTIRDDGDIGGKCLECRIYESTDCVVSWDDVGAPTDVEVLCKSRISDNGYSSTTGVVVRGSGSVGSYSGYLAHISDSDVLQLRKRTGGALDYLIKSEAFTVDYDTWYWIRFRAIGTSLKVRVWEDGDAEPGTWLIDETDSDVTGSGWVAHRFSSSTLNYGYGDCDYFSVGVCGDDAGTVPPTTVAPTTIAPTTLTPTTGIPTTLGPTTLAPTSLAPTTIAPTSLAPTSLAPTTTAPTSLSPTTLAPTTCVPVSYVTNFSEYTTDQAPNDWTERFRTASGAIVVRNDGDIGGKCLEISAGIYGSRYAASWNDLRSPEDIEILAKARVVSTYSQVAFFLAARGSGGDGTENYYMAQITPSLNKIEITEFVNGAANSLSSVAFTCSTGVWYWMRFQLIGTALKLRVWADGDAEPDTWQCEVADSSHTVGWAGLGIYPNSATTYYCDCDYYSVGICGDNAGTVPPTTIVPTTLAPTTAHVATTPVPTTSVYTTIPPTTELVASTPPPTTLVLTTIAPTTTAPTSLAPTTLALTTTAPTTLAPTTLAPTTLAPTSLVPTTSAPTIGTVCWGHDTGVVEDNIRNFNVNWTGTGQIVDAGVADTERILFDSGESEESETWHIGSGRVRLTIDKYDAGFGDPELKYKQGNSEVNCEADIWHDYTIPFVCSGWIKVKISAA